MAQMLQTADVIGPHAKEGASIGRRFLWWLLNDARHQPNLTAAQKDKLDWFRIVPFVGLHLGCMLVVQVGASAIAVGVAAALYLLRMFFVTAFYHRYFSHRAFRTGRVGRFVMGALGATAGQRGPIWWAAHHREHHLNADTDKDPHSPRHRGVWFSHTMWFLTRGSFHIHEKRVKDWLSYRELRLLEKLDWIPFVMLGIGCYALGHFLEASYPSLNTNGPQMFVWGFLVSTVVLYHATYSINSVAHRFGKQQYPTNDESRNNFWLAFITLGEGWHNNHHHYPISARQGFQWWELDISYLGLKLLALLGVVEDLRPVPKHVLDRRSDREGPAR